MYISESTIDKFIKEDVPYIDLTTTLLGISDKMGSIKFYTREDAVISGSEEVMRIFGKLGIETIKCTPSGICVKAGEEFIIGKGCAKDIHMAWKVCLNILEYSSAIATRTKTLVDIVKSVNKDVQVVTTRKSFPGTKELTIKSILAGAAYPHRLGVSETILIFSQHINFIGGYENLSKMIPNIKKSACEKKVIVEVDDENQAIMMAKSGVDGIQFDKIDPIVLKDIVNKIKSINKDITLIAAGGINKDNAYEYAQTGVCALATTSVYFGKPIDMSAKIEVI